MYYKYNVNKTIQWKGFINQFNMPNTNGPILQNAVVPTIIVPSSHSEARTPFKANPIRAPRRQLLVDVNTTGKKAGVSQLIDRPGGAVCITKVLHLDISNCPTIVNQYILNTNSKSNYLSRNKDNCELDFCYKPRVRRPASTIIKNSYSTTNAEYLRKRVRLYKQNQTLSPNVNSASTSNYDSTSCYCENGYDLSNCCSKSVVYNPSNKVFQKQGAVSSSLRALNLKVNNVKAAAQSSACPWGKSECNNNRYRGSDDAPYTNKSKYNLPLDCLTNLNISGRQPSGGIGRHTICYSTRAPDFQRQLGSVLQHVKGPGTGLIITNQYLKVKKNSY